jgi:hypothetical protein
MELEINNTNERTCGCAKITNCKNRKLNHRCTASLQVSRRIALDDENKPEEQTY